jgi:hypothetical protein
MRWCGVALGEHGFVMKKIPLLYRMIRGAVGKRFVVKHYKGGKIVITKYPDMSGIVLSGKQRVRRDLFREAVVYAKWIVGDEARKKAFRKTLPWKKRKHVYQAAIRLYMRMHGDQQWLRKQLAVRSMTRVQTEDALATNGVWVRIGHHFVEPPDDVTYNTNHIEANEQFAPI